MAEPKWSVRPVTAKTWPHLEALFEAKGGPKNCWCMVFRQLANRSSADKAARKQALHLRVLNRTPIGLLGYVGREPVAWCSVAPRETFTKLRDGQSPDETNVWSVVCFYVRRDQRDCGWTERMLEAAMQYAAKRGARVLEGYPVDPGSPSYRFMGFVKLFKRMGFAKVGKAGSRRHVMQRELPRVTRV